MMRTLLKVGCIVAMFVIFFACGETVLGPDPENTPENNFELLWHDFDRLYPFFTFKNINWDSLHTVYRPRVSAKTSAKELFDIMSEMINMLKDGHVNLYWGTKWSRAGIWDNHKTNFIGLPIIRSIYLKNIQSNTVLTWGELDDGLAYIHINSFSKGKDYYKRIDKILTEYAAKTALIIDVRSNGGGNSDNAEIIASRFMDQKRLYCYTRRKAGPGHDDLDDFEAVYLNPQGSHRLLKPVVVLTNRGSFSATERFVFAMRVSPNVTIMGDTTGGGIGNPVFRELPNGMIYRLPRVAYYSEQKELFEGIGIAPDVFVENTESDVAVKRDTILETAIQYLKQ